METPEIVEIRNRWTRSVFGALAIAAVLALAASQPQLPIPIKIVLWIAIAAACSAWLIPVLRRTPAVRISTTGIELGPRPLARRTVFLTWAQVGAVRVWGRSPVKLTVIPLLDGQARPVPVEIDRLGAPKTGIHRALNDQKARAQIVSAVRRFCPAVDILD